MTKVRARGGLTERHGSVRSGFGVISRRCTPAGFPNAAQLRDHYEHLPARLAQQNINPEIPWLYNYKLDFRFR